MEICADAPATVLSLMLPKPLAPSHLVVKLLPMAARDAVKKRQAADAAWTERPIKMAVRSSDSRPQASSSTTPTPS